MQTLSRVLVVLVAILSIAFMGFAGVVSFGGPNWKSQMDQLEGYTFKLLPGETPTWEATRLSDREVLSDKSSVQGKVLAAAMKDKVDQASQQVATIKQQIPALTTQQLAITEVEYLDKDALKRFQEMAEGELVEIRQLLANARTERETLMVEVKKVEDRVQSRREDVFRLETQHQLVLSDVEALKQNIINLEEQIVLLEDDLDKLLRRSAQLDRQGVPPAPVSVTSTTRNE